MGIKRETGSGVCFPIEVEWVKSRNNRLETFQVVDVGG
jgi:hypothetical protein